MESRSRAAGDLARMTGMPKIVDYAGRFAFFELASFTFVRDHGVDHLSRNALARVLATSPGVSAPSTADVPADTTFDPEHDLVAVIRWIDKAAVGTFLGRLTAAVA